MKGFCLFAGSKASNNEEFRRQLKAKNKFMWLFIVLGIFSAAVAYYCEFFGEMNVDDYMLGVYCGIGVGVALLIRNKRLLKDEAKLKEARLEQTDERNVEIGIHAQRIAAMVLLVAMYLVFLLGGLYDSFLSKVMACLICLFVAVYSIAWRVLNKRM